MTQVVPATTYRQRLQGYDDFVRQIMQEWQVPGAALALVTDTDVLFSQGFGKRDLERDLPVTEQTRFAIGSCTKAFTAMTLAMLVDESKLAWDTPVRHYLPSFKLFDSFASERLTPRDLLTHRSGLPYWDLVFLIEGIVLKELFTCENTHVLVWHYFSSLFA